MIAAKKTEGELEDVTEVRSKAASVEVNSTCNGGELVTLTQQVAYLISIVENKKKFSKEKGNQRKKRMRLSWTMVNLAAINRMQITIIGKTMVIKTIIRIRVGKQIGVSYNTAGAKDGGHFA